MKQTILLLLSIILLGCQGPTLAPSEPGVPNYADLDHLFYEDPEGLFSFEYPSDWIMTESSNEIQFWNNLEEGQNTLKVALFESDKDFEIIQERNPNATYQTTETNAIPTLIKNGSLMGDYQIYYYDLGDTIVGLSAYFDGESPEVREQATQVQQSFRTTEEK